MGFFPFLWGRAGAAPDEPEDADETVTSRLDVDGNSVLVAQLGVRHAGDSLRNAELSYETRAAADRFLTRFVLRRASDDRARGMTHRIRIERRRAGEAGGIAHLVLSVTEPEHPWHDAADVTARLDREAHSLIPPALFLRHSPDSLRRADLLEMDGSKQDRYRHVFAAKGLSGIVHRVRIERCRAGEAGGLRVVALDYETMTDGIQRITGEAT